MNAIRYFLRQQTTTSSRDSVQAILDNFPLGLSKAQCVAALARVDARGHLAVGEKKYRNESAEFSYPVPEYKIAQQIWRQTKR